MKIAKNKAGLTLVEVLVATAIAAIACVAIIQFYLTILNLSEINKEETIAISHLTNIMEAIKCTPFSNILVDFPNGVSDGPAGNNYATVVGGYVLASEHIVVSYVNPSSDPLEISVGLTWNDKSARNRTKYLITKRTR